MRSAAVTAIALLLLVSCKSQEDKAQNAREKLASWVATGQMLSRNWARGVAIKPYARSTVRAASDEVEKLREPLKDDSTSMQSLDEVSKLYEKLSHAVEQDDRSSGEAIARAFAAIPDKS